MKFCKSKCVSPIALEENKSMLCTYMSAMRSSSVGNPSLCADVDNMLSRIAPVCTVVTVLLH